MAKISKTGPQSLDKKLSIAFTRMMQRVKKTYAAADQKLVVEKNGKIIEISPK